jgi:hypothetical protein
MVLHRFADRPPELLLGWRGRGGQRVELVVEGVCGCEDVPPPGCTPGALQELVEQQEHEDCDRDNRGQGQPPPIVVHGRPDRPPARRPGNRRDSGHEKHAHRDNHDHRGDQDPKNATATTIIRPARIHPPPPGFAITASNQRMGTSGVPVNRGIDPDQSGSTAPPRSPCEPSTEQHQSARRGHQDKHARRPDRDLLDAFFTAGGAADEGVVIDSSARLPRPVKSRYPGDRLARPQRGPAKL